MKRHKKEMWCLRSTQQKLFTLSVVIYCSILYYLSQVKGTSTDKSVNVVLVSERNENLIFGNERKTNKESGEHLISHERVSWKIIQNQNQVRERARFYKNEERLMTLFTFIEANTTIAPSYRITLLNWPQLKPFIIPVLFTNDIGYGDIFRERGWEVLPLPFPKQNGRPTLKYMFLDVMKKFDTLFYGFASLGVLYTHSLSANLQLLSDCYKNDDLLIVGKTHDIVKISAHESETLSDIVYTSRNRGQSSRSDEISYFITSKNYDWDSMKPVPVDTNSLGNWIILEARRPQENSIKVIDVSSTVLAARNIFAPARNKKLKTKQKRTIEATFKSLAGKPIYYKQGTLECVENEIIFYTDGQLGVAQKEYLSSKCDDLVLGE